MKNLFLFSFAVITLLQLSCAVTSRGPLGTAPMDLGAKKFEGEWEVDTAGFDDVPTKIRFETLDAAKGRGRIHYTIQDTKEPATFDVVLMQTGAWVFGSRLLAPENDKNTYQWLLLKVYDGRVVGFLPRQNAIEPLIKEKKISGKIVPNRPELSDLTEADYRLLTAPESGGLYYWEHPIHIRRLPK